MNTVCFKLDRSKLSIEGGCMAVKIIFTSMISLNPVHTRHVPKPKWKWRGNPKTGVVPNSQAPVILWWFPSL